MSAKNFAAFFAFIERPDFDGQALHRTAGDPGGDTSWGWTLTTWQGYCYLHGGDPSLAVFAAMTKDSFKAPTRILFWNHVLADQLPSGIDVFWADFQFGSGGATRVLQKVIYAQPDGHVGPQTLAAANCAAAGVLDQMLAARLAYYQTLAVYKQFGNGWNRRALACAELARGLL